jgi:hypothetical protein
MTLVDLVRHRSMETPRFHIMGSTVVGWRCVACYLPNLSGRASRARTGTSDMADVRSSHSAQNDVGIDMGLHETHSQGRACFLLR